MAFSHPARRSLLLADTASLPASFYGFVLREGGWHQGLVCLVSVAVFLLNAAPIELQRRIIDLAVKDGAISAILMLIAANGALILAFGLLKLLMNVYRAWLGESATLTLRMIVESRLRGRDREAQDHTGSGTGLSMILAEADDVGAFVGSSISLPVVEAGFLISVFIYLTGLDVRMTLLSLAVLLPQFVFVPIMQKAINRRVASRTLILRRFGSGLISMAPAAPDDSGVAPLDAVFMLDIGIFKLKFSLNFLMNLGYSLGNLLVLGIGALLVVRGQVEIATVVTFMSATAKVVDPWNDMVDWARNLTVATVKYRLIVEGCAGLTAETPPGAVSGSG